MKLSKKQKEQLWKAAYEALKDLRLKTENEGYKDSEIMESY
jgi:hypothetical protein